MGCCFSAQSPLPASAPEEERIIAVNEADLRFYSTGVTRAFDLLEEGAGSGQLSPGQFQTWTSTLDVNTLEIDTVDSKLQRLFKRFREGKGRYSARKLAVLTVLLTQGGARERAEVLYRGWLLGRETDQLDRTLTRELLATLLEIAAEWLPELAIEEISQHGRSLSKAEVTAYVSKLKSAHDMVFQRADIALSGPSESISREEFTNRMLNDQLLAKFLTSSTLRLALLEAHIEAAPRTTR